MTNVLNYLKGNYLISENCVYCSIESLPKNELQEITFDLFCFSINHNIVLEDRTKIIIDFDINFKYNLEEKLKFVQNENKIENVIFSKQQNNTIYIQIGESFNKNLSKNGFLLEKNGVFALIKFLEKIFEMGIFK